MEYARVQIPTNQEFLTRWHLWVQAKVAKHFIRHPDRIADTAQNVRYRLLNKDFISRWFYKHLTDDLIDKREAERILGGIRITFIGSLKPIAGHRADPDSLWRIKDILEFAKFNYDRYYYSIQNHTINSDKVLELLGYEPGNYGILESLYRQGRLKPSLFTEHVCSGPNCLTCASGKEYLVKRKISLAHRWSDPEVAIAVKKLRWNDSQLRPFLREWKKTNLIKGVPRYILRQTNTTIDAGLLKYAQIIIDNEVVNDFKRMTRYDDLSQTSITGCLSPELSTDDIIAYESSDDADKAILTFRDSNSSVPFELYEKHTDIHVLINKAHLTTAELQLIQAIYFNDLDPEDYSKENNISITEIKKMRSSVIKKLQEVVL